MTLGSTARLHLISRDASNLHRLDAFIDVFEAPGSSRHQRAYQRHACDRRIHLLPNADPADMRTYRYPQLQKDELEKHCATMLEQGIIRPSTSPFSAPVLLVRKGDRTWCFCVDYRALNNITVKDMFPIPVVEELLDELHAPASLPS